MVDSNEEVAAIIASQGVIGLIGTISGKVLRFAFIAFVVREVSQSTFGIYTLGLSIVLFISNISNLSLDQAIDYFVPIHLNEGDENKARSVLFMSIGISILGLTAGSISVYALRNEIVGIFGQSKLQLVLPILAIFIIFDGLLSSLVSIFNSDKKVQYKVLCQDFLYPLFKIFLVLLLLTYGLGLTGLVLGHLVALILTVIIGFIIAWHSLDWIRLRGITSADSQKLLSYSIPLITAGIINSLVGNIDYFVIGYYKNPEEVGIYKIAFVFANLVVIFAHSIRPILKPMLSEVHNKPAEFKDRYSLTTRWITICIIPTSIFLSLGSKSYLSVLFSPKYTIAGLAVIALIAGWVINLSVGMTSLALESIGRTRAYLVESVIVIIINIILDILLVPHYGFLGAAIATSISMAVTGFLALLFIYRSESIHPFSIDLLKTWISGGPTLLLIYYISNLINSRFLEVLLLPISTILIYIIILFLIDGFNNDDKIVFKRLKKKISVSPRDILPC